MFINFFYHLRDRGLDVSPTEFLALLDALDKGLARESLDHFYVVARSVLVKRVEHYDRYDQAFMEFFRDATFDPELLAQIRDELWQWLDEAVDPRKPTPEELAGLEKLDLDELRRQFAERLAEQTERHDRGNRWVGTGGTSPFGHGGQHPSGIRVGGSAGGRTALQVAAKRRFRNLRKDLTLDVRDIGMALRRLRELTRDHRTEELDLQATIDKTANNAGDIELVFTPPRKNNVKLLLLTDVGGSMNPYAEVSSRLFSAAHQASHFQHFESYYFHNCPYETLWADMERGEKVGTDDVFARLDRTWRCIVVGDAAMAPSELTEAGGSVNYWHFNERPGLYWLRKLRDTVPRTVWLNPDNPKWWGSWTTRKIKELFEMYPLTMEGLEDAVEELRRRRV